MRGCARGHMAMAARTNALLVVPKPPGAAPLLAPALFAACQLAAKALFASRRGNAREPRTCRVPVIVTLAGRGIGREAQGARGEARAGKRVGPKTFRAQPRRDFPHVVLRNRVVRRVFRDSEVLSVLVAPQVKEDVRLGIPNMRAPGSPELCAHMGRKRDTVPLAAPTKKGRGGRG